jgi:undecaprenyl-diphosphatase
MEQAIVDAIALMRFPAATVAVKWITVLGEWWVLLAALVAVCFVLLFQKRIQAAFCFGAGYAVLLFIVYALKEFVQRPRPVGWIVEDSLYSFPSAHSALSVYLFGMVAYLFATRIKQPIVRKAVFSVLFIIPLIIAFTRLYLGMHFLSDVLAGLFLGAVSTFLTLKICKYPQRT